MTSGMGRLVVYVCQCLAPKSTSTCNESKESKLLLKDDQCGVKYIFACLLKLAAGHHKGGDDQVGINRKNCQRGNLQ